MEKFEVDVPCGQSGDWRVEEFTVSEEDARFFNLVETIHSSARGIDPGVYKRLVRGKTLVMSNSPAEVAENTWFPVPVQGRVLINGLGLGITLKYVLSQAEVTEVTVVEKSLDVIRLVVPTFEKDPRVKFVHADAFEYKPDQGATFDIVWHDIWDNICSDNLPEMTKLHRKYAKRAKWQGSWAKEECLAARRRWGA